MPIYQVEYSYDRLIQNARQSALLDLLQIRLVNEYGPAQIDP